MDGDGLDLVVCSELKHTLVDVARSDNATLNGESLSNHGHVRNSEVTVRDGEREDVGSRSQDREEQLPVGLEGGGDEKAVDGLLNLELFGSLGGVELGSTQLKCLLFLGIGSGEDDNLTTHLIALALTVDNFTMDTYDLREDLKLENKQCVPDFVSLSVFLPRFADASPE